MAAYYVGMPRANDGRSKFCESSCGSGSGPRSFIRNSLQSLHADEDVVRFDYPDAYFKRAVT